MILRHASAVSRRTTCPDPSGGTTPGAARRVVRASPNAAIGYLNGVGRWNVPGCQELPLFCTTILSDWTWRGARRIDSRFFGKAIGETYQRWTLGVQVRQADELHMMYDLPGTWTRFDCVS